MKKLLLLVLIVATGCHKAKVHDDVSFSVYAKSLRPGMTREQVCEQMGPPTFRYEVTKGGQTREFWNWFVGGDGFVVFEGGQVSRVFTSEGNSDDTTTVYRDLPAYKCPKEAK